RGSAAQGGPARTVAHGGPTRASSQGGAPPEIAAAGLPGPDVVPPPGTPAPGTPVTGSALPGLEPLPVPSLPVPPRSAGSPRDAPLPPAPLPAVLLPVAPLSAVPLRAVPLLRAPLLPAPLLGAPLPSGAVWPPGCQAVRSGGAVTAARSPAAFTGTGTGAARLATRAVPPAAVTRDQGRSRGIVTRSRATIAATVTMARTTNGVRTIDSQMTDPENRAAHRYMIRTLVRCEWPMASRRCCRCFVSGANTDLPARVRRTTAISRSA